MSDVKFEHKSDTKYPKGHDKEIVTFRETHEHDFNGDGLFDIRETLQEMYEGKTIRAVDQWINDKSLSFPIYVYVENIESREGKLIDSYFQQEEIKWSGSSYSSELESTGSWKIQYNKRGDISQIASSSWDSGGTTADALVSYDYDTKHLLVKKITEEDRWITLEEKGDIDTRTNEEFKYDRKGNLVEHLTETLNKYNGDYVISYPTTLKLYRYDGKGNVVREEIKQDLGSDGMFVSLYTKDITYDIKGNIIKEKVFDYGRTKTTEFQYDANGNLLKEDKVSYGDYRYITEFQYDKKGNVLTEIFKSNTSGGDEIEQMIVKNIEYDKRGNILTEDIEHKGFSYFEDGVDEFIISTEFIDYSYDFDKKGNVLSQVKTYDEGRDGLIDRVDTYKFQYNKKGEMISKIYEEDLEADGLIDYKYVGEKLEQNNLLVADYMLDQLVS